jgi:hypothetical protein
MALSRARHTLAGCLALLRSSLNPNLLSAGPHRRIGSMRPTRLGAGLALLVLVVAGCGGGLEGDGTPPGGGSGTPVAAEPANGTFTWVLRPVGSSSSPRYGLSLIHPEDRGRERVIEPDSAAITDARLLSAGALDVAGQRVNGLRPHSLVYITAGDVRRVPLAADGRPPRDRVQRAQSATACRFIAEANDPADPLASRLAVSTTGTDGRCDTADDGWAEVGFDTTGAPRLSPVNGTAPLAALRDASTLRPRGWVFDRRVGLWSVTGGTSIATRMTGEPSFRFVVASAPRSALVDDGTRLSVLESRTDGSVAVQPLDATLTAGGEWQRVGFDADHWYVFRSSAATPAGSHRLLRIARNGGGVTLLASGDGVISNASMGSTRLYATVVGVQTTRLLSLSKTGGPAQVLETGPVTTLPVVLASASGVHQLFRITNLDTPTPGYAVEMIDESGQRLWTSTAGGYPLALVDGGSLNLNGSESRNRFVVATGYGARAFGDATLVAYDAVSRAPITLGTLPGSADFGVAIVFADVTAGPGLLRGGFVGRSTGTEVVSAGARAFSFDAAVAGSLRLASPDR